MRSSEEKFGEHDKISRIAGYGYCRRSGLWRRIAFRCYLELLM
jgi:hypothetical protein